jgi:hypothetical protein
MPPETVDRALWTTARRLDWFLWKGMPEEDGVALISRLPALLERIEQAGIGGVTAFTYFWEGFIGSAGGSSPAVQAAIGAALRRLSSGGENCRAAVVQALECAHGMAGAATLAAELLARADLGHDERTFLTRLHEDLSLMERRMSPPR